MRFTVSLGHLIALCACSGDPERAAVDGTGGSAGVPVVPGSGGTTSGTGGASSPGGAAAMGGSPGMAGALPVAGAAGTNAGGSAAGGAPAIASGGASSGEGGAPPSSGGAPNGGSASGGSGGSVEKARLAVTADFLNQSLSVIDLAKLTEGKKREDALVGTVDLTKYTPGPLDLAITPDGKTAVVAVSGGWLSAFTTVPPGNGTLLFVDIATRTVSGELYTGASPMGIAITKDGKRAFVGQYGETYFAIVDIEKRSFTKVQTGAQFNEELAIDDTGTVGILTYGPAGNCITFSVDSATGPNGATVGLTGDAGGAAFFPGTKLAFVVQAPTTLTGNVGGHNIVDVTNPKAPVASDNVRVPNSPTWYPVTAVASRNSVAVPSTSNNKHSVVEWKLDGMVAKEVQTIVVGDAQMPSLAYGVSADSSGRVYTAMAKEHAVAVVDLNAGKSVLVPWNMTKSGPTDIKLVP